MSDTIIRVEELSKLYRVGANQASYGTLRDRLAEMAGAPWRSVRAMMGGRDDAADEENINWALKDVSFEVARGEVVGIIGHNGAGKSTLLKILSRITEPTSGYADIGGRIGSLLEVGTGFHPELTGRENIYLNGAILGMRRAEIARRFDEIVEFAEVSRYIDTPVKRFSSGMYLRLAFAVAAHLNPEIMVVDEVLAVGDVRFQRKCLGKMQEVGEGGRTVLFVSHDMSAIARLASRTIVLEHGRIGFQGATDEAIHRYSTQQVPIGEDVAARTDRKGDGVVRIKSVSFYDDEGKAVASVGCGEPLTIAVAYESRVARLSAEDIRLDIKVLDMLGHPVTTFSTRYAAVRSDGLLNGSSGGVLTCRIPGLNLAEEVYSLDMWLFYLGATSDKIARVAELRVTQADYYGTGYSPIKRVHGPLLLRQEWSARDEGEPAEVQETAQACA